MSVKTELDNLLTLGLKWVAAAGLSVPVGGTGGVKGGEPRAGQLFLQPLME